MNIRLPTNLEEFVQAKVASGLYADPSEVIGDALRLLRRRDELDQRKLEVLRQAVAAGEGSGLAENSSFDMLSAELEAELDGPHAPAR
jgi:antitoxin ParD1/3/4